MHVLQDKLWKMQSFKRRLCVFKRQRCLQDCRVRRLVEESEQIRREFQKYIDLTFDFDPDAVGATLKEVEAALRKLMSETQWVPRNWVFS